MASIPQQVVDAILAGVRTASVDVQDVSPERNCSKLEVIVVSKYFENLPKFKRRNMINSSLDCLRKSPDFGAEIVELTMLSPSEAEAEIEDE